MLNSTDEQVTLTLNAATYLVERGPNSTSGVIAVRGDQIEFSQSTSCPAGTGTYRWSLSGTSLLFTVVVADGCPGRSEVLAGQTYTKR